MKTLKLNEKYLIVHVANNTDFDENTFKTLWVNAEKTTQEILGYNTKSKMTEVQSYAFAKSDWDIDTAREWIRDRKKRNVVSVGVARGKKCSHVYSPAILCASKPNLAASSKVEKLTKEMLAKAEMNTKYFFFVEGVHEGKNGNGDVFTKDELTKNYKSAGFVMVDWEHDKSQIIGFSLESELVSKVDHPLALAINGIIDRMSPFVQMEERDGEKFISRDDIIKQRFFEDRLAVSMECFFDKMKCQECGFETDDVFEFDWHVLMQHRDILESGETVGRELIGVDFVGWGLVEQPADGEAFMTSLRTDDSGLLEDIFVEADDTFTEKSGNMFFASAIAAEKPDDFLLNDKKVVFASEKLKKEKINEEITTKIEQKIDNNIIENISLSKEGGLNMFKLLEKISGCSSLSEFLVVAQNILKDHQGNKPLSEDAQKAFSTELSEAVAEFIKKEGFSVGDVFTLTETEKAESLGNVRTQLEETQSKVETAHKDIVDSLDVKVSGLEETIATMEKEKTDAEEKAEKDKTEAAEKAATEKAEAEKVKKVDDFMTDLSEAGVNFSDTLKADMRKLVETKVEDEEALKSFKKELVASNKQTVLENGSIIVGDIATGGPDTNKGGLEAQLEVARKEFNKKA